MSIHVVWAFALQLVVNLFINCLFWSITLRLFAPISLTLQGWFASYGELPVIWAFTLTAVFAPALLALFPNCQWIFAMADGNVPATNTELHRLKRVWTIVCRAAGVNPDKFLLFINSDMDINACAIGSKYIAVNRGTLLKCHDDELAGILAHELGHNQKKHTPYLLIALGLKFCSSIELLIFKFSGALVGLLMFIPVLGWVARLFAYILFIEYWVLKFVLDYPVMYLDLWANRRREFEADAFAVDIGFGECLYRGLFHISTQEGASGPRFTEDPVGYVRAMLENSHPRTGSRMEKIKKLLEKRNTYHNQGMVDLADCETERQAVIESGSKSISDFLFEKGLIKPVAAASCACAHCHIASHEVVHTAEKPQEKQESTEESVKPKKKEDERLGFFDYKGMQFKQICPFCSGDLIRKTDKRGKTYLVCENSKYWRLGTASCDFRRYE